MGTALGGPATSGGAANAATYQGLKNQLINENLSSIAAQDVRLAAAAKGNVAMGSGTAVGNGINGVSLD